MRYAFLVAILAVVPTSRAADPAPTAVEPADLTRRPDLIGREVVVDDRLRFFAQHGSRGFDEIALKRTEVPFRLASALRPGSQPVAKAVTVRGVLRKDGPGLVVEVTGYDLHPADMERLRKAVEALAPADAAGRLAWADWAERRSAAFRADGDPRDDDLAARGAELKVEALRIEAEQPAADRPARWIALAQSARSRGLPEAEAMALAHRGFRAKLAAAKSAADAAPLPESIAGLFPNARDARPADPTDFDAAYARDPAPAYRAAPARVRATLDRRLYADAVQTLLERQLAERPGDALKLADRAAESIPERPAVAARFRDRGVAAVAADPSALREDEVRALADRIRDEQNQPEKARTLLKSWLDGRRAAQLSPTDAEGRLLLARQYDAWLGDRATAASLLREVLRIDAGSEAAADAFRRYGFRKVGDDWVEPAASRPADPGSARPAAGDEVIARGMTRDQVRSKLGGKPDRVVRVASQGEVVEQWIYRGDKGGGQVINFSRRAGSTQPTVLDYYAAP